MKPELCVICDSDRVFLVFIGDDRQDRAKYLFSGDGHVVLHIDEHGRFYKIARLKTLWLAFTADQHVRAFLNTFADVPLDPLVLLLGHHRPYDSPGIGPVADWKVGNRVQDCPDDCNEAALWQHKSSPRDAG